MISNERIFDLIVLYKGDEMPTRAGYYHLSFYEDQYSNKDLCYVYDSIRLQFKKADYIIVLENNVVIEILRGGFKK